VEGEASPQRSATARIRCERSPVHPAWFPDPTRLDYAGAVVVRFRLVERDCVMSADSPAHSIRITHLLGALAHGEREAWDELVPLVYGELRRMARRQLARERREHTFDSGALVHEAFLRLNDKPLPVEDRAQFFGVAAHVMRQVLVDHARARRADKRGGGGLPIAREDHEEIAPLMTLPEAEQLLALDESLKGLAAVDAEAGRMAELRSFAGATEEEAALALGISPATARRRWAFAKAWLRRDMAPGQAP